MPFVDRAESPRVELSESNKTLAAQLRSVLTTYRQSLEAIDDHPFDRREQVELDLLKKALRAEGYYAGRVVHAGKQVYRVDPGPRFLITTLTVTPSVLPEGKPWPVLTSREGRPLRAQPILDDREKLLHSARRACYPEARVTYDVLVDTEKAQASVQFNVQSGPRLVVGDMRFEGLETLSADFVRNVIEVKSGDCLRRSDLDQARLAILQTGRIASVNYRYVKSPSDKTSRADVVFDLTERKNRSVTAAIEYTSDTKEGFTLGWEHRNLFGDGEHIELETGADQINRYGRATFTLPQFYHPRQELQLIAVYESEEPDAYTSRRREISAILSREWSGGLLGSVGVAYTESRVSEDGIGDNYSLLSLPTAVSVDRRDDVINPRHGWHATLSARPFTDISSDLDFAQSAFSLRYYRSEDNWPGRPTIALRGSIGSINGASLERIPADLRYYVGGGGSVRGYPYQSVGELTDGEADGGKSYGEASVEMRWLVTENWGLVLFSDGGYAYPDSLPSYGQDFLWGAGVGLRYLTRFAPIRFDVAFPLNRRPEIDDSFQIYISFGQAF